VSKAFESRLRFAARRLSVNLLIHRVGWVLMTAAAVLAPAILIERLLSIDLVSRWSVAILAGVLASLAIATSVPAWPDRMQAALVLDTRLRLKERFSTTLLLASSQDPFAQAACREARGRAHGLDVRRHFPLEAPPRWRQTAFLWVVVAAMALWMPQKDLLGLQRRRQQEQTQQQQQQQAQTEVVAAVSAVESAVQQLNDPNLADAVGDLLATAPAARPAEVKREAIRKLGELADKIHAVQNTPQAGAAEMLKNMLKGLRGSTDELSMELRNALAKGDFAQARRLMADLQKVLAAGQRDDAERKQLSEQFENLARELQALADKQQLFEKELEKLGLDKSLAQLDPDKLREALKKAGISNELLEKLMQQAAACDNASGRCSALAQALAGCAGSGGLSAGDLSELLDQLSELEALDLQLAAMQASLAEIARAIAGLGQGMCEGLGGQGPFAEGALQGSGPGTGGPGVGFGPRDSDSQGDTATAKTIVKSDASQGPAIASWYFKDVQIKGQATRDFSQVVQSGRDRAAEAISQNEIPRKYEQAVKQYFGALEQSRRGE